MASPVDNARKRLVLQLLPAVYLVENAASNGDTSRFHRNIAQNGCSRVKLCYSDLVAASESETAGRREQETE